MTTRHVELDHKTWRLLVAVAAGRLRRHRGGVDASPRDGTDWELTCPAQGGYRGATKRLRPLVRVGLIELVDTGPGRESWPWRPTAAGQQLLATVHAARVPNIELINKGE